MVIERSWSWGVEVRTLRDDIQLWWGNALRFATEREAEDYAAACFLDTEHANRWRVFPSLMQPNASWHEGAGSRLQRQ